MHQLQHIIKTSICFVKISSISTKNAYYIQLKYLVSLIRPYHKTTTLCYKKATVNSLKAYFLNRSF